ncbi:MAG: radical SAM protein, partial [Candidatus Omnitrophica bacterium]|nr:radical SAM protein [Candidatus Omnitrophota bacterium]
ETGIRKVRLTGGEPLVRRKIESLIKLIKMISSISEISMTTNGLLLGEKAFILKEVGLERVNVSLNTLKEERYEKISGYNNFRDVWNSIQVALRIGFNPVKINTILFKGINDDEIIDFAELSLKFNLYVRFIEYFSTQNEFLSLQSKFVPNKVVKEVIEKRFGRFLPAEVIGNGPAINYRISGAKGSIGFINSNEGYFCDRCNRLRLSSVGKLYPCLFSPFNIDLKEMLRGNLSEPEIMKAINNLIRKKHNYSKPMERQYEFAMNSIGG